MTEIGEGLRTKAFARQLDDVQRQGFRSFFDHLERDTPAVAMLRRNAAIIRQQEQEG